MKVDVNTVETVMNNPECMILCELQHETALDNHLETTERMHHKRMAK